MTPDEQHALADRLDGIANGELDEDLDSYAAAAGVLRATASNNPTNTDSDAVIDVLANIPTAWNGDQPWKYLMDQGDAEVALLKLREAGYIVVDHKAMRDAAVAEISELERQIDALAAERDAAVAEVQQLRNAIGDPDELRAMAKYGTAENGHGDDLNEVAHRIADAADAADEVAAVSPAIPTPTTCPTCGSDDRRTYNNCVVQIGPRAYTVDPWHTDNTP